MLNSDKAQKTFRMLVNKSDEWSEEYGDTPAELIWGDMLVYGIDGVTALQRVSNGLYGDFKDYFFDYDDHSKILWLNGIKQNGSISNLLHHRYN